MRVVFIIRHLAQLAGLDRIISYKINYLAEKMGYDILLITYEQGNHPLSYDLSPNVNYVDLDVRFFTRYKYNILKRIYLYFMMRKEFKKKLIAHVSDFKPDVIVTTTYSYLLLDVIVSSFYKKNKIVIESHIEYNSILKRSDYKNNVLLFGLARLYDRYILHYIRKCDAFVSLTELDRALWPKIDNKYVIPNPVVFQSLQQSSLQSKKVISVGRLDPQKGYDMLISAWSIVSQKHPDWSLDIFGDGELHNTLYNQIISLNLSKTCNIHNAVPNIKEKYLESSIYVMSSRCEGFGLVLIEAMTCGLPCISFDCPCGPSDIISNNEDGILVEANNIQKLADSICYLIENLDVRMKMGRNAKKNVERYSPEEIMPIWNNLFLLLKKQ